jgi:hypothetical protein
MPNLFFDQNENELSKPEDVKWLLADPERQWVEKFSAYETAYSWFDAQGIPKSIQSILRTMEFGQTRGLRKHISKNRRY